LASVEDVDAHQGIVLRRLGHHDDVFDLVDCVGQRVRSDQVRAAPNLLFLVFGEVHKYIA